MVVTLNVHKKTNFLVYIVCKGHYKKLFNDGYYGNNNNGAFGKLLNWLTD